MGTVGLFILQKLLLESSVLNYVLLIWYIFPAVLFVHSIYFLCCLCSVVGYDFDSDLSMILCCMFFFR